MFGLSRWRGTDAGQGLAAHFFLWKSGAIALRSSGLHVLDRCHRRGFRDGMNPNQPVPKEPVVTPELVAEHGLKPHEYARVPELIRPPPPFPALALFPPILN